MIGAHQAENRSRGWILIAVRWIGALAVLGILIHFLPLQPLWEALQRVPLTRFIAVLIGYLLAHTVGIAKWRMVVNAAGGQLDFRTSAQCYTGGLFATLFLPSIIGGDVVRLAVGLRRSPNPAGVLAGNVLDRFLDMCAQAGLVLVGMVLLPGSLPASFTESARRGMLALAGIFAGLVLLTLLLYKPLLGGRSVGFRRKLARLRHALRTGWRKPHVLAFGWILGTAIQSTFLILTALLAISCGLLLPSARLVFWLATGKTRCASAFNARRNRREGGGARGITRSIWRAGFVGACLWLGVGGGRHRGRIDCGSGSIRSAPK